MRMACGVALSVVLLFSTAAIAVPTDRRERDHQWRLPAKGIELAVTPLYAYVVVNEVPELAGAGLSAAVRMGIADGTAVRIEGLWTQHTIAGTNEDASGTKESDRTLHVLGLNFGVTYAFDISRFEPKVELSIGVMHQTDGIDSAFNVDLVGGIGFDYAIRPWLTIGAAAHYHAFLASLEEIPVFVDIGPRVAIRYP